MSKARTLNPYDMEARIHDLEENGGGGGGGGGATVVTQHLASKKTDGNGVLFLDLAVDDYILVGVSTKDFSSGWGPMFQIGCWQEAGTYKYAVKLSEMNGRAKASSLCALDIAYMARPTA